MRTAFFLILVAIISISVGSIILGLTNMLYMASESQGPYSYHVNFGEGIQAKDLGVMVHLNLSHFVKNWFVGEENNVVLEVSVERVSTVVQNFSWRIFWVELLTFRDRNWHKVAHGSSFLNESEWSDSRLYKRQDVPVGTVNLNHLESVEKAWFRIGIMMDIHHNNTEYSLTFYTPIGEIGPVAIFSPLYSPISLAVISTATTAISTTLIRQLQSKTTLASKKRPFLTDKAQN